jgi:drug/metabolite transporter (DMT)-like permease
MNDIVFAFLFGILLFHEIPSLSSVLGATFIVGCTTALGLHKWYMSNLQAALARQRSSSTTVTTISS